MNSNNNGDTLKHGLLLLAVAVFLTALHFFIGGTDVLDFVSGFFLGVGSVLALISVVLCIIGLKKIKNN